MGTLSVLKGRYELKEVLGQGGMGVVRRAYDTVLKCDAAVKMIRDAPDPAALQMFNKECEVLASLNHPNIIQILDQGEFEEDGHLKPYFVMPLLPGRTLDKLIEAGPLTAERCLDILTQVCRGLAAAHEQNLIHRDLKPSNIFVMPDDAVEIIDFGVCHMASGLTTRGQKGTIAYMAPELIEMKAPSPLSDVFALGVIAYQMFSRRRPFDGASEREIAAAILNDIPRPLSEVNPAVSAAIGRVVHKTMAKQPWHRFGTAKEFAECLQKAHRNEPIDYFDPGRFRPRLERARKAFGQGDHQFATEILGELESEGHQDPDIAQLHREITVAAREKRVTQLLESAHTRLEEDEHPLALQKVQEALSLDPGNAQALELKAQIERTTSDRQMEGWLRLARQHLENRAFGYARDALRNVLQVRPEDLTAAELLREVEQLEQDEQRDRKEKDLLYQSAVEQYRNGEISNALGKLQRVIELDRKAPDRTGTNRSANYQNFYNEVRSEYDSVRNDYEQAKRQLEAGDFPQALEVCRRVLGKYPSNALFIALKFDIEERRRQALSAFVADVTRRVDNEADLNQKVKILDEALAQYPEETHFVSSARLLRERLSLVAGIVSKAKAFEDSGQFAEALGQWDILKTIQGNYPGLEFEIERVKKRRDQQIRAGAKVHWLEQIDSSLELGQFAKAAEVIQNALQEFPGDAELVELEKLARKGGERLAEAQRVLQDANERFQRCESEQGIAALRQAHTLDKQNPKIRTALAGRLAEKARALTDSDLRSAEETLRQALDLDPANQTARGVRSLLEDRKREEFLGRALADIRQLQAAGDVEGARTTVERALAAMPNEPRLLRLKESLRSLTESDLGLARRRDLEELKRLAANTITDPAALQQLLGQMLRLAAKYPRDAEFREEIEAFERRAKRVGVTPTPAAAPSIQTAVQTPISAASPAQSPPASGAIPGATGIFHSGNRPPMAIPVKPGGRGAPAAPEQSDARKPATQRVPLPAGLTRAMEGLKSSFSTLPEVARQVILAALLVIAALVVAAVGLRAYFRTHQPPPPVVAVKFQIHSDPPGASIFLDNTLLSQDGTDVQLRPGDYTLSVQKEGYESELLPVFVTAAGAEHHNDPVQLRPIRSDLTISTPFRSGQVFLDEMAAGTIANDGQATLAGLQPGSHRVKVESGQDNATFDFELQAGTAPSPKNLKTSTGLDGVILSALKDQAIIESTFGDVPYRVDDSPPEKLQKGYATRSGLALGAHAVKLGEGDRQWSSTFEASAGPRFILNLLSLTNTGLLAVEISAPAGTKISARVSVNKMDWGLVQSGFQRSLPVGDYDVSISQQGYNVTPDHWAAMVKKGIPASVKFQLTPIQVTKVEPLDTPPPPPRPKPEPAPRLVGHVRVDVYPSGATVEYRRVEERSSKQMTNPTFEVDPGDYVFSAQAQGFTSVSKTVHVGAGGDLVVVALTLPPEVVKPAAPTPITHNMDISDWAGPWQNEGEWFVHNGGDFFLYKITPAKGEFRFSLRVKDTFKSKIPVIGTQRVKWVVGFKDTRNFVEMDIGQKSYRRKETKNGVSRTTELKAERKTEIFELRMVVQGSTVTVELKEDGGWTHLDSFPLDDSMLSEGRFGFADSLKLKDFIFIQQPVNK